MKKGIVLGIVFLFVVMSFTSISGIQIDKNIITLSGRGDILYVGGSGSGNYTTIQDAINDAVDGDTVFVFDDGSPYYERVLEVDKSINLIGEDRDTTIIDGGKYVIRINADWVNISGFTIKNGSQCGIYLYYYANNNNILDNIIVNNDYYGILSYRSYKNIIMGNIITSNKNHGITLEESSDNIIINNNINSQYNGITSDKISMRNFFSGNIFSNNTNGIVLAESWWNTILDNDFLNNTLVGFWLSSSASYNTISNNSFFNNGLLDYGHYSNVSNNTVNGKPLVYLEDESDLVIDCAGQIILKNCDNITIKDQDLSNASVGIYLSSTNNCIINNNKINSNNFYGIILGSSSYNNIKDNIISNSKYGLRLLSSSSNTINGNTISNNEDGLYLFHSSNNITDNNISSNKMYGIYLRYESNSNNIYHNNFIDNNQSAFDECNNTWDEGYPSGGNYWDDYNGTDNDEDGIGDTPYPISGGDNEDRYPLMYPTVNFPPDKPIIYGPISGKVGVEYEYNFSLSDLNEDKMHLRVDWGSGTPSKWYGPYDSGAIVKLKHIWSKEGTYAIRAQTMDSHGEMSDWGEFQVTMPRNRDIIHSLLLRLSERFPLFQRLLDIWRWNIE